MKLCQVVRYYIQESAIILGRLPMSAAGNIYCLLVLNKTWCPPCVGGRGIKVSTPLDIQINKMYLEMTVKVCKTNKEKFSVFQVCCVCRVSWVVLECSRWELCVPLGGGGYSVAATTSAQLCIETQSVTFQTHYLLLIYIHVKINPSQITGNLYIYSYKGSQYKCTHMPLKCTSAHNFKIKWWIWPKSQYELVVLTSSTG